MQQHVTFIRNDIMPSWWANAIQRRLSVGTDNFILRRATATTVEVPAAIDEGAVIVTIDGRWRWVEATVSRPHPGGAAGTYVIWAVAKANDVRNSPAVGSDFTDYAFDLRITSGAEPAAVAGTVDIWRRIGTCVWDGVAITSVTQELGYLAANDARLPTTAQKAALAGSTGVPSDTNRYVTQSDPILGSGAPTGAAGGELAGNYPNPTIGPLAAGRVLTWGGDTTLFREQANTLKTGGTFKSGGGIYAAIGLPEQVYMGVGAAGIPTIYLGSALDTNLYRAAANVLKTDDNLHVVNDIYAYQGAAGQVRITGQDGVAKIVFGSALDTDLFRAGVGHLKTDAILSIGSQFTLYPSGGNGMLAIIPALGGVIRNFLASGHAEYAFGILGDGRMNWGAGGATGPDTNLYRAAANILKTDDQLQAALDITANSGGAGQVSLAQAAGVAGIYFGVASDASIRRAGAAHLETSRFAVSRLDATEINATVRRARMTRSSAWNVPTATHNIVTFTTEEYDNANIVDIVAQPTRLTAPVAGLWLVNVMVDWGESGTSSRRSDLLKNGVQFGGLTTSAPPDGFGTQARGQHSYTVPVVLAAGDYVQMRLNHGEGAALNVTVALGMVYAGV